REPDDALRFFEPDARSAPEGPTKDAVQAPPSRPPQAAAPEAPPVLPAERPQSVIPMPEQPPPILMDVTPHSLAIATAGGYSRRIIAKNAPVPTEQSRSFTTARDDQREVAVRICQGEQAAFDANEVLGEVVLDQLPPRPRGELSIAVTFILDADGTLAVEAKDAQSGRSQQTRINLRGGLDDDEVAAMRLRLESEELGR
ncbi:MAG TPA: Hsp70 family protein, partial [Sandaracinaceae bacterium LLY-WYZ-13_1]|nr:Hsp70 family protein [Sandaracinaceae bacterium LLY-WYZ-13_1]